ncbi:MAG TPA: winged-helix domain-containing protein, partial [Clostridiales bacterium]|nr:winged-helix domain-containing protein [Clostridiales bacterium]
MGSKYVSIYVIKRLPRYYRFLGTLQEQGIVRISSRELAERMGLSASQIRQDLNCFGGFGQQGYGYNIDSLHDEIG